MPICAITTLSLYKLILSLVHYVFINANLCHYAFYFIHVNLSLGHYAFKLIRSNLSLVMSALCGRLVQLVLQKLMYRFFCYRDKNSSPSIHQA